MTTATLIKFNKLFKVGTKVKVFDREGWWTVKSVHSTRQWVELEGLVGSFQRGHIEKFTNRKIKGK